jgi:adenosine deaminase/adenosine deaminase CECR1
MPKGDLHHYSGSIYAEPILEDAINEDFLPEYRYDKCLKRVNDFIFSIKSQGQLALYKKNNGKWSVKTGTTPDKLFFESFDKFSVVGHFGTLELKQGNQRKCKLH